MFYRQKKLLLFVDTYIVYIQSGSPSIVHPRIFSIDNEFIQIMIFSLLYIILKTIILYEDLLYYLRSVGSMYLYFGVYLVQNSNK